MSNTSKQQETIALAEQCNEVTAEAVVMLDSILTKISAIKTAANNVRWRLNSAQAMNTGAPTKGKHEGVDVEYLKFEYIQEAFYTVSMAAKLLGAPVEYIEQLIANGELNPLRMATRAATQIIPSTQIQALLNRVQREEQESSTAEPLTPQSTEDNNNPLNWLDKPREGGQAA